MDLQLPSMIYQVLYWRDCITPELHTKLRWNETAMEVIKEGWGVGSYCGYVYATSLGQPTVRYDCTI